MMDLAFLVDAFANLIYVDVMTRPEPELTEGVLQAVGRISRGALAQDLVRGDP
jgi:hypothetical protein